MFSLLQLDIRGFCQLTADFQIRARIAQDFADFADFADFQDFAKCICNLS